MPTATKAAAVALIKEKMMARIKEKNLVNYKIKEFKDIRVGTVFKYHCDVGELYIKVGKNDNTNGFCLQDGLPGLFEEDDLVVVVTDIEYELEKE